MSPFIESRLSGCFLFKAQELRDARGSFLKLNGETYLVDGKLLPRFYESYVSVSHKGVLRGMHFQVPPHDHAKFVVCLHGRALDAVLDLRVGSPTYGQHELFELGTDIRGVYLESGFAHGFYALTDHVEMLYQVTSCYAPQSDRGLLWNSGGIEWPSKSPILSERDAKHPLLAEFSSPFVWKAKS